MTTLPIAAVDLLRVLDAPRVASMQQIRQRIDDRLAHATQQLEAGTQSLVKSGDSAVLEHRHQTAVEGIEQEGEKQLEKLVAEADPSFIAAFEHARELLGPSWPLDNTVALSAPAVKQDAAA
jgi:predicted  nucleic acid-binding Zn-ribbon protein